MILSGYSFSHLTSQSVYEPSCWHEIERRIGSSTRKGALLYRTITHAGSSNPELRTETLRH